MRLNGSQSKIWRNSIFIGGGKLNNLNFERRNVHKNRWSIETKLDVIEDNKCDYYIISIPTLVNNK